MAFSLTRNAKLYVSTSQVLGSMTSSNTWEIPIMDGFSFSAATSNQEITISEAGATPNRGQKVFTTAIEPVTWSLSNYMRPREHGALAAEQADCVERILWEGLAGKAAGNTVATNVDGLATTLGVSAGTGCAIDFLASNSNELIQLSLVFRLDTVWYHITGVVVDTAEIDFSIDAIASIAWGGFGLTIVEVTDPVWTGVTLAAEITSPGSGDYILAPTTGTLGCIRNKLSVVTLIGASGGESYSAKTYACPLTGGSLSIANNITFLTPEALGVVNRPCGHFTGARTISGNMTAYLNNATNGTADLMTDLLTYANTGNANPTEFSLVIDVGGAAVPYIEFDMPTTHITIPSINIEDVVAVDIPFTALPHNGTDYDLASNNELVVTYYPSPA